MFPTKILLLMAYWYLPTLSSFAGVLNNITGNALKYKDKEHGNIRIALSYKPHKHKNHFTGR